MKKIMAILLAAAIAVTASGCGGIKLNDADSTTNGTDSNSNTDEMNEAHINSINQMQNQTTPDSNAEEPEAAYPTMWEVIPEIDYTPASDLEYKYDSKYNGISVTGYKGSNIRVRIPEKIESLPVVCVDLSDYELIEVVVPDTVQTLYLNNAVMYVNCPEEITDISSAFGSSNLEAVYIAEGVTSIGDYAFYECTSLTSVTIPDSVTSIDSFVFDGCENLTNITYKGKTYTYDTLGDLRHAING